MAIPTIQDVIDYLQGTIITAVGAVDGVDALRASPDEPPEKDAGIFPASICFVRSANWTVGAAGVLKGSPVTIALFVYVGRMDLPRDTVKTMPFSVVVPRTIWNDPTLGGKVSTVQAVRQVRFGELNWGSSKLFGFEWEIDVKFETTLA